MPRKREWALASFLKSQWAIVVLTLMTFLIAYYLDYFKNRLDQQSLLIGASVTFAIVLIAMLIFALLARIQVKEDYEERYKTLEGFIQGQGLGNIISEQRLADIESKADEIWVFTHDMSNDIGVMYGHEHNKNLFETVKKNLHQGKKYIYFLPQTQKIYGSIHDFQKKHDYQTEQVRFCLIPAEEFHFLSETVVYDANTQNDEAIAVQWFPSNRMNYYIQLDSPHRNHLIGIGKTLMKKYQPVTHV